MLKTAISSVVEYYSYLIRPETLKHNGTLINGIGITIIASILWNGSQNYGIRAIYLTSHSSAQKMDRMAYHGFNDVKKVEM